MIFNSASALQVMGIFGNVVHLLTSILNPVSFTSGEASEHCTLSVLGLSLLSCFSNLLCEVKRVICGLG